MEDAQSNSEEDSFVKKFTKCQNAIRSCLGKQGRLVRDYCNEAKGGNREAKGSKGGNKESHRIWEISLHT